MTGMVPSRGSASWRFRAAAPMGQPSRRPTVVARAGGRSAVQRCLLAAILTVLADAGLAAEDLPPPGGSPAPSEAAQAAATALPPVAATPGPASEDRNLLDATRAVVRDATAWLVRGIDGWFGDRPFEQRGRVGGRIRLGTLWRQDEGFDWLTRFSVRAELPNLRERGAFLYFGRDNQRDVVADRPEGFTRREALRPETREDQSFFAGLGSDAERLVSFRLGFRGGLKPYAQGRLRQVWEVGERSQFEFRETVFWTLDERFGSTTAAFFDTLVGPSLALRWQTAATISQESDGVEWSSSVGLYRAFGFQRQLSLEGLVNGATANDFTVSEYGVRARWEQPVYKDWLLMEAIVGYFWPRRGSTSTREQALGIGLSLQMLL